MAKFKIKIETNSESIANEIKEFIAALDKDQFSYTLKVDQLGEMKQGKKVKKLLKG